ncbi:MAG TPA: serine hydrolase domain-containing protein [Gemmatimonadales bacterium]|nr:serine hydrolase domain-containing protein [Gemmatimonadales bacterium]
MLASLLHALLLGGAPPTVLPDTIDDRRAAHIDSIVRAYHGANRFDGVVLVGRGDTVLRRIAVGMADHVRAIPLTQASLFPICSITKQLTAALVLRLVEQGRLSLDTPVRMWLPELRDRAGDRTLHQLLSHSAGLPNLDEVLPMQGEVAGFYTVDSAAFLQAREVTRRFARIAPGDTAAPVFRYNNLDYIVVAAVIEAVTGRRYAEVLRMELLQPLGMDRTGLLGVDRPNGALVPAWDSSASGVRREERWRLENYGAAGALFSTADDLQRWHAALLGGRVLGAAALGTLFSAYPAGGFTGLGSFIYRPQGLGAGAPEIVDREGAIGAYLTNTVIVPESGYTLVVLSNVAHAALGAPYRGEGLVFDLLASLQASR